MTDGEAGGGRRRRPGVRVAEAFAVGVVIFRLAHGREGFVSLPSTLASAEAAPLLQAGLVALGILAVRAAALRRGLARAVGPGRRGMGWREAAGNVLAGSALRGLLDARAQAEIQGRMLDRRLSGLAGTVVVTRTRIADMLGLTLVGGAAWIAVAATGALDGWSLWSGALILGGIGGTSAVMCVVVFRGTTDPPSDDLEADAAKAHRTLGAALRGGPRAWGVPAAAALGVAAMEVAFYGFLFRAFGLLPEPGLLALAAPAAVLVSLLPFAALGLGLRDLALVWILGGVAPTPVLAAVGVLAAGRLAVEAAAGAPALLRERRA